MSSIILVTLLILQSFCTLVLWQKSQLVSKKLKDIVQSSSFIEFNLSSQKESQHTTKSQLLNEISQSPYCTYRDGLFYKFQFYRNHQVMTWLATSNNSGEFYFDKNPSALNTYHLKDNQLSWNVSRAGKTEYFITNFVKDHFTRSQYILSYQGLLIAPSFCHKTKL